MDPTRVGGSLGLPACALEGCDTPVVRHDGGGRPKLYCCDAHRALARRRRLRSRGAQQDVRQAQAIEALRQAVALVEEAVAVPASSAEARLAEARAQATAQVLEAQRLAADAARELVTVRRRYEEERARWEAALTEARQREALDRALADELRAALEGARAELEDELLRHHRDVQALQDELARRGSP